MKKMILMIVVASVVIGCNTSSNKKEKESIPEEIKSTEPDTTGYYAARELEGIYEFKLDKTTVKDLKKIEKETYQQ